MSADTTLTPKQREAIYEAWLAALRSGRYKQGRRRLEHDGEFCCLGVLCHVLHLHPELGIEMLRHEGPDGVAYSALPGSWYETTIPSGAANELGLLDLAPGGRCLIDARLAELNDEHKASFAEIAQYIEDAIMPLLRTKGILPPAQQEALEGAITPEKDPETHGNTNKDMTDASLMMEEREQRDEALLRQALEALEALKAENEMLRKALKDADNELDWLDEEVDTCDHSVGVCMCDYWNMRRKMKAALASQRGNADIALLVFAVVCAVWLVIAGAMGWLPGCGL